MKVEIKELLKKAGYKSQAELAKALVDGGFLTGSYISTGNYLCQVLKGNRPASEKMMSGLHALCGEEIKSFVRVPRLDNRSALERGLEDFLEETYRSYKTIFSQADPTDRMKMCMDFKQYVDNYTQSKDEDVTPRSSKP